MLCVDGKPTQATTLQVKVESCWNFMENQTPNISNFYDLRNWEDPNCSLALQHNEHEHFLQPAKHAKLSRHTPSGFCFIRYPCNVFFPNWKVMALTRCHDAKEISLLPTLQLIAKGG